MTRRCQQERLIVPTTVDIFTLVTTARSVCDMLLLDMAHKDEAMQCADAGHALVQDAAHPGAFQSCAWFHAESVSGVLRVRCGAGQSAFAACPAPHARVGRLDANVVGGLTVPCGFRAATPSCIELIRQISDSTDTSAHQRSSSAGRARALSGASTGQFVQHPRVPFAAGCTLD